MIHTGHAKYICDAGVIASGHHFRDFGFNANACEGSLAYKKTWWRSPKWFSSLSRVAPKITDVSIGSAFTAQQDANFISFFVHLVLRSVLFFMLFSFVVFLVRCKQLIVVLVSTSGVTFVLNLASKR